MKLKDLMAALKAKGSESTKLILLKHGALELFATGNGDAQCLAGMVAGG